MVRHQEQDVEGRELARSRARGAFCIAHVCDVELADGWLSYGRPPRRQYAPFEHPDLPHRFAQCAGDPDAVLEFVRTYGSLGWARFAGEIFAEQPALMVKALNDFAYPRDHLALEFSEDPLAWAQAQAASVKWALDAGIAHRRRRRLPALPAVVGFRARVLPGDSAYLNALELAGFVNAHTARVTRALVAETKDRIVVGWQAETLIEAIYSLLAESIAGGRIGHCQGCGRAFYQTDPRQQYCPPGDDSDALRSPCSNRARQRRFVARQRRSGRTRTAPK